MPQPDEHGPAYLRTYSRLDWALDLPAFQDVCEAEGLPRPTKRMYDHVRAMYRAGQSSYLAMNDFDQRRKARRETWTIDRVEMLVTTHAPETASLEFKSKVGDATTTKKPWAALANAGGGDVLYGVAEVNGCAGELVDLAFAGVAERFVQLNEQIDPPVALTIEMLPRKGGTHGVVWVRVRGSAPGFVHLLDGRAPIRSGATTRNMTSEEIRRWVRERQRPAPTQQPTLPGV